MHSEGQLYAVQSSTSAVRQRETSFENRQRRHALRCPVLTVKFGAKARMRSLAKALPMKLCQSTAMKVDAEFSRPPGALATGSRLASYLMLYPFCSHLFRDVFLTLDTHIQTTVLVLNSTYTTTTLPMTTISKQSYLLFNTIAQPFNSNLIV